MSDENTAESLFTMGFKTITIHLYFHTHEFIT